MNTSLATTSPESQGPGGVVPVPASQETVPQLAGESLATSVGREARRLPDREELVKLLRNGEVDLFNKIRPSRGLDLSGVDLQGLDLRKVNLSRCNLSRANLTGCRLEGADLSQADITRADLTKTWLSEAKFKHANADYACFSQVREARAADFQAASLLRADLSSGNFSGAMFNFARLHSATLSGGDFSNGEFLEAQLAGSLLNSTKFCRAHLERARLFQASGKDIDFTEANLCDAEAAQTRFSSSNLKRAGGEEIITKFDGAWILGLLHDGFGSENDLLLSANHNSRPPEGMFPQRVKPERMKLEIDGMPGTNLELYEQAMAELDALIGLKEVKQQVKEQFAMMRFQYARSQHNLAEADLNLHFVFTGSPGTGKTTVARIMAKLLHSIGYLKKGQLVEVQKSHLIAGYQGQTPMKTEAKVAEALDGTLFIDEAYSLTQNEDDDYSKDCIATILKMMEDNRGRLTVIAAGYAKEMESFVKSNSGLESRFTIFIDFPDYSNSELAEILKGKLNEKQFKYDGEFLGQASVMLAVLKEQKGPREFANARVVRNLIQQSIMRMASRVEGKLENLASLTEISPADLPFEKVFGSSPGSVDFSAFRWKDKDGKELGIKELSSAGTFPNLTSDSMEMAKSIAQIRKLEGAEEDLDELEERVQAHAPGNELTKTTEG